MEKEKAIQLLREFINKLDREDFNLEAWKNSVTLILERIFGNGAPVISKIQELSYHMSSWALRDTLGKSSWEEQIRRNAKEIMETAILELEIAGTDEEDLKKQNEVFSAIEEALENELKGSQYKALQAILAKEKDPSLRKEKVKDFLQSLDQETLQEMLTTLLSDDRIAGKF